MALDKNHSSGNFVIKALWILFIVFHEFNLVICGDLEDDNLKKALEAIERRQKELELQENEYYGQPENIGYGFQKSLGFFDDGNNDPTDVEIGNFNFDPKNENEFRNGLTVDYQREGEGGKRKSNFRERMASNYRINYLGSEKSEESEGRDYGGRGDAEYSKMLRDLWSKYRQSRGGEDEDDDGGEVDDDDDEEGEDGDLKVEDLSDDQLEEILNSLIDGEAGEERFGGVSQPNGYRRYEVPPRPGKNYRVFERLSDRRKRYPSFGEGFYGKRNYYRSQHFAGEENPGDFVYSPKYVDPESDRDGMENLREGGFEILGDDRDGDVMRILKNAMNRPRYFEEEEEEEVNWPKKERNNYGEELWLRGPVTFSEDPYQNPGRNEKKSDLVPGYFKPHEGIRLNSKRIPVKRSSVRVRKETKNEKVSKELKGIFGTAQPSITEVPPKKGKTEKKPAEVLKKQNATKPEVTKHRDGKKMVRSAAKYGKNEEIAALFNGNQKSMDKKSIDWSQYFGIDKRSSSGWLKNDYLTRAESHFLQPPKTESRYQIPFDTRRFEKRNRPPTDIGTSIDRVENKIEDIEEKIIDDALKYTGAHSGGGGRRDGDDDLNRVKSKVIQHLEAAYSLEKMKKALEEFKNLIKPGRNGAKMASPKKSVTEAPKEEPQTTASASKENSNLEKPLLDKKPSVIEPEKGGKQKKKAEGVKEIFGGDSSENLEFLNNPSSYSSRRPYEGKECPVLDQVLHNCLRIEEMSGKYAPLLVPLCSLQQICYFCGGEIGISKMSVCDSMYLAEAQNMCQGNNECLVNARDSLMALKDLYEQDFMNKNSRLLLSGSCLSNPCIQRYFLNSPGAIYSLEVQN